MYIISRCLCWDHFWNNFQILSYSAHNARRKTIEYYHTRVVSTRHKLKNQTHITEIMSNLWKLSSVYQIFELSYCCHLIYTLCMIQGQSIVCFTGKYFDRIILRLIQCTYHIKPLPKWRRDVSKTGFISVSCSDGRI